MAACCRPHSFNLRCGVLVPRVVRNGDGKHSTLDHQLELASRRRGDGIVKGEAGFHLVQRQAASSQATLRSEGSGDVADHSAIAILGRGAHRMRFQQIEKRLNLRDVTLRYGT